MQLNRSILLVDDDEIFRHRLLKAFKHRRYEAYDAGNLKDAIALFSQHKIDQVVLDLRLGSESGLDLIPKLLELNPKARILILTGYGTISTAVEALKKGAYNYLSKPTDADSIAAALQEQVILKKQIPTNNLPALGQVEWDYINRILNECSGNISKAAKILGIHRRSLQRKLSKNPGPLS